MSTLLVASGMFLAFVAGLALGLCIRSTDPTDREDDTSGPPGEN